MKKKYNFLIGAELQMEVEDLAQQIFNYYTKHRLAETFEEEQQLRNVVAALDEVSSFIYNHLGDKRG